MNDILSPDQRNASLEALERSWRDVLRPPDHIDPVEWCERHIDLSRSSAKQGLIQFSFTPYLREIVRTIVQPVDRVTLCFSSQVGKSLALTCIGAYSVKNRPTPILFAISTKELAEEFSQEKLDPVLNNCKPLQSLLLRGREDDTTLKKRFKTCTWILQGGQSKRGAKHRSVGLLMLDEIEDMPTPVYASFGQRIKGFPGAKIYEASTPDMEEGRTWKAYLSGSCEKFHVRCPFCDEEQSLEWEHLKFGDAKQDDDWDLDRLPEVTYYKCPYCSERIDEHHKPKMLESGRWIAEYPERKRHRSFTLNALYSPLQEWHAVAREFLEAEGHPLAKREWRTGSMATPWTLSVGQAVSNRIVACCRKYERGVVPCRPGHIIVAADYGKKQIHWVVAAVEAANKKGHNGGATFIIDHGTVDTLEHLKEVGERLFDGYAVTLKGLDCGFESTETKEFCRLNMWYPIIGSTKIPGPYRFNKQSGHILLQADIIKDILNDKIDMKGRWNLFADDGMLGEFVAQLAGEVRVLIGEDGYGYGKRKWKRVGAQHYLDAAAYIEGMIEAFGCRFASALMPLKPKEEKEEEKPKLYAKPTYTPGDRLEKYGRYLTRY
ncbi:MAG TPA: terminase gpA endonuclease subunit [Planctomycetaceae bacterium]|nr:terminase gpA endonuclease subunit [Planctomycetaceae bacterium]